MLRREFVRFAPAAASALVTPLLAASAGADALTPGKYETYEAWVRDAQSAARAFIAKHGAKPEPFIQFLALWATAMPEPSTPEWQPIVGANRTLEFASVSGGRPFVVSAFRMAPHCLLPAHCHPGGGGITLCTRGSLDIEHFDLIEGSALFSATGGTANIVQASIAQLSKDQFTHFTPNESNLHQLRAGAEGAMGIDILVQWQGAGEFSYLKFAAESTVDSNGHSLGKRRSGTWVGMDISRAYHST